MNKNNNQKAGVKKFKRFTLRLDIKTYNNLKAIQEIHNKNPIAPFLSLNKMMNKGLAYKYSSNLVKYLKREILTDDEYAKITEHYQSVLKVMQHIQWQLSNIANNDNQIAKNLNSIHDNSKKSLENINEQKLNNLLNDDEAFANTINAYWKDLLKNEGE